MAHNSVWGYLPIQKQNKNSKKLTQQMLSESGLSRYTTFGRAYLSDKENETFVDLAFYIGFPDLITMTSSTQNIMLEKKQIRD